MSNRITLKIFLLFLLSVLIRQNRSYAQIIIDEPPKRLYYERTHRITEFKKMKDMRDVLHYNKLLMGKNRISGNISYNTGRVIINTGKEIHKEYRSALGLFTRIRFLEEFSINTVFYKDFNRAAAAPWIADYNYAIGRYAWKPRAFNFGYENYINNKYHDNLNTMLDNFKQGYYFMSYNFPFPEKVLQKIKFDSTTSFKFIPFVRYSLWYKNTLDEIKGGLFDGKTSMGLSCRYTIFWNIYIESAVYYYVDRSVKMQPWDPDYSYGFGYFDWRAFRLTLTYGNWAINRFPGEKTYYPGYGFIDGNFRIAANYTW